MLEKTVCNDSKYLREYIHSGWSQGCNDVFNRVDNEVSEDVAFDDLLLPKCLSTPSAQQFKPRGLHAKAHSSVQNTVLYIGRTRDQETRLVHSAGPVRSGPSVQLYCILRLNPYLCSNPFFLVLSNLKFCFWQIDRVRSTSDPCLQSRILTYLNRRDVQKALYANTTDLPGHWDFCLGFATFSYFSFLFFVMEKYRCFHM